MTSGLSQGDVYKRQEKTRALIKYDLPLNEIIYDFFDALKSRSRGYASFDYEMKDYERSELVKLDILINKEMVDALSFIVFKAVSYTHLDVYKRQSVVRLPIPVYTE